MGKEETGGGKERTKKRRGGVNKEGKGGKKRVRREGIE